MFILDSEPHTIEELDSIVVEAVKNGIHTDNHKRSFYNIVCAFDIETTSFNDLTIDTGDYKDTCVYDYLRGTKIKITQQFYSDILDFNQIRRKTFGQIYFSKTEGISVDSLYRELSEQFPYYFKEENVFNISDQLEHILYIFNEQRPKHEKQENTKRGIMYIWQLAINGHVIIGRTNEELVYTFNRLSELLALEPDKRLIVYVHNLAFEFQFIRKLFEWDKVFSIDTRKPVYAITNTYIEFRCSYILTNYSLSKLGEQLHKYKVSKLVGDLDYSKPRHAKTIITREELQYCINDVLVVSAYIQECIETEKRIYKIPLTCTGYCRRYVRRNCLYGTNFKTWKRQFRKYHALMMSLKITDLEEYKQLKRAFAGGFTHATNYWSGYTVENVDSIDFTSSYPYVLMSEQFPMSTGRIVVPKNREELEKYLKKYWCLFDVRMYGVTPILEYENYISVSKCYQKINATENNGRVYSADMLSMTICSTDLEIIRKTYNIERMEFANFRIYQKGYLPKEVIESIIKLYSDKTTLKGVAGKEQEYLVSKGLLNSVYGMMVTDFIRDEILYTTDWETKEPNAQEQLDKYNVSRRRFLFFPWGVACTAFARRNLFMGEVEFCNMNNGLPGCDALYADTDSLKVINIEKHRDFINKYNELCAFKLQKMCEHYGIDYNRLLPKTIKGEVKPLGVWDNDGHYDRFKAIRAKAYLTQTGDKISLTVSGINKNVAVPYLVQKYGPDGIFREFKDGLEVPGEYTGKLTHYYIDVPYKGIITDYNGVEYEYNAPSGVYFEKAAYNFDMSAKYIEFLKGVFYTK